MTTQNEDMIPDAGSMVDISSLPDEDVSSPSPTDELGEGSETELVETPSLAQSPAPSPVAQPPATEQPQVPELPDALRRQFEPQTDVVNQMMQEVQQLRGRQAEQDDAASLADYARNLEMQGFQTGEVQPLVQAQKQAIQQQRQLVETEQRMQQNFELVQKDFQMKTAFASMYSKQYSVSVDELMKLKTPEAMEIRGIKAENARLKQAKQPAQTFDNNRPSPSLGGNRARRLEQLGNMEPGSWSDAQYAEFTRLMAAGG